MKTNSTRIEAFSDGVIAIIITVMVFDLKLPEATKILNSADAYAALKEVLPKMLSYLMSFMVLAIMWVNHHHVFNLIKEVDNRALWLNIHLLFWMSLIPFSTNFMGANPFLAEAIMVYGLVFFMNSFSFMILRNYASRRDLMHEHVSDTDKQRARVRNIAGIVLYLAAAFAGYWSPYVSFGFFILVPAIFFSPKI